MGLLKAHSHTFNGLAMEPGIREDNELKETQTLQQGKPPIKNLPRTAGVAGGGRKGSRTSGIPPVWRGGRKDSTTKQPQKRYYGEASPRRCGGEHRR